MCNGDLGMYRVMPWAYPTIPGQSSGGASVDPIPEPTGPYDFSNYKVEFHQPFGNIYTPGDKAEQGYFVGWFWGSSGLITYDTSNVSTISIIFKSGSVTLDNGKSIPVSQFKLNWAAGMSETWSSNLMIGNDDACQAAVTRSYGDSNNLAGAVVTGFSSDTVLQIDIYDSNGSLIQSAEVAVS